MPKESTAEKLRKLQEAMSGLKLDDSVLFLNHVLGVSREEREDISL